MPPARLNAHYWQTIRTHPGLPFAFVESASVSPHQHLPSSHPHSNSSSPAHPSSASSQSPHPELALPAPPPPSPLRAHQSPAHHYARTILRDLHPRALRRVSVASARVRARAYHRRALQRGLPRPRLRVVPPRRLLAPVLPLWLARCPRADVPVQVNAPGPVCILVRCPPFVSTLLDHCCRNLDHRKPVSPPYSMPSTMLLFASRPRILKFPRRSAVRRYP
ncbi:hypothetical protein VTO73DRAFT_851 [Trametes versicolor]